MLAIPLLAILYFAGLTAAGMLGPDEPRYASIGREMARSGDWITPRLWGAPWFEKPALLYWMTGAAFRLGFGEDLAPRVPVALLSLAFLIFFQCMLSREFGARAAWAATLMLGTSAAWLGCSFIGTTDLPMTAAFSAAMLLSLDWLETGDRRRMPLAAALLGVAVLAKGLVPLVLTLPLVWCGRRRWTDLLRLPVSGAFLIVALPWYPAALPPQRRGLPPNLLLATAFRAIHYRIVGARAAILVLCAGAGCRADAMDARASAAGPPRALSRCPPPLPVTVAALRIGLLLVSRRTNCPDTCCRWRPRLLP